MKSKIALAFQKCKREKRPALITYTVAGDNNIQNSIKIMNAISRYADILELGFPHNTPIADGGQIQTSSYRAIKNGTKIKDVFEIVKDFIYQSHLLILDNSFFKDLKSEKLKVSSIIDLKIP